MKPCFDHCFTEDLVRERTEVNLILSPLPNFCFASLYLDTSYGVKPQLLENIGVHIIQKCGLRVQKQVVKEVQMLVQHTGATLVHWISTDALVQHCGTVARHLFNTGALN